MTSDQSKVVDGTCRAAWSAWGSLADAGTRAGVLEALAAGLDEIREEVLRVASEESALTPAELAPEFARMTGTLRQFAAVAREGSWIGAMIDHASPEPVGAFGGVVGPAHDVRRVLVPLGPVSVFGASNFPLAYGACGGDTASALAAGCPVIVKEHPAHPRTGRLIVGAAREALRGAGHSEDLIALVENADPRDLSPATALVGHPMVRAVGFTGSQRAGLEIARLARERAEPIPAYCEMGSCNPVVVTREAAVARGEAIGRQVAESILLRHGQQCTCPGLLILPPGCGAVVEALAARLAAADPRAMLAPWVRDGYLHRLAECRKARGVETVVYGREGSGQRQAGTCLLRVGAADFAAQPVLHEEVFGPSVLVVELGGMSELRTLPLRGALVGSLYGGVADEGWDLARNRLASMCGRVVFEGVPTGVRVAGAMVHGGPFPATNRPESTACGPMALARWCRPVCLQNAPKEALPAELRDGSWHGTRVVDGRVVPGAG
ncbi:MAG: aldehyde dehydrogenase family protein [Leptolyngbya sp. PLA1]|nr:aldehyde dehydrogenase family protein [Leptolyngbya sp. PLA1]